MIFFFHTSSHERCDSFKPSHFVIENTANISTSLAYGRVGRFKNKWYEAEGRARGHMIKTTFLKYVYIVEWLHQAN